MQLIIRADSIEVSGYVNAVERKSRPLHSRMGEFVERICKGAFQRAIDKNDDIRLLLNHDRTRDLGGTKDGNLELSEDNIGLRVRAIITDPDVIETAKQGGLVGWSFGFKDVPDGVVRSVEGGMPVRDVKEMDLREVSILDRRKTPAYDGTLVNVRADDDVIFYSDPVETEVRAEEEQPQQVEQTEQHKPIDYAKWENIINEMKGEGEHE